MCHCKGTVHDWENADLFNMLQTVMLALWDIVSDTQETRHVRLIVTVLGYYMFILISHHISLYFVCMNLKTVGHTLSDIDVEMKCIFLNNIVSPTKGVFSFICLNTWHITRGNFGLYF